MWWLRSCLALAFLFVRFGIGETTHERVMGSERDHALFRAIRQGDSDLVQSLIRQGVPANLRATDGSTPLMVAALHGTADIAAILVDHGADVNLANDKGVTALLWGVGNESIVRLLLNRGADIHAQSALGNNPIIAAAAYPGNSQVIEMLLAKGADPRSRNNGGATALRRAVQSCDVNIVKCLLASIQKDHTHDLPSIGASLLEEAASLGQAEIVEVLLRHTNGGDRVGDKLIGQSLNNALLAQNPDLAKRLIECGANLTLRKPNGRVPPIVLSAYTETGDTSVARLMIERGADLSMKNEQEETVLTWARRRGHPELIDLLVRAGAPESPDETPDIPQRGVNVHAGNREQLCTQAIRRSLELLQHSSDVFLDVRGNCVSCHHQNLPSVAIGWARDRGFPVDRSSLDRMIERQERNWRRRIDRAYEMDRPVPVPPRFLGYGLWGFSALGYPANDVTEAFVWYLAQIQQPDGHWVPGVLRPPMGGADITATVLAMRSLQLYSLRGQHEAMEERVLRAATWLSNATPRFHQERVFQLLGLSWANFDTDVRHEVAETLLLDQREDGGWSQLKHLESDAWATGQALVALFTAGELATSDPAYQRGIAFLLRTQFDDGSWYVQSRTWPFQPPFDSEFPHGRDQWISAPATAWAMMALLLAIDPASPALIRSHHGAAMAKTEVHDPANGSTSDRTASADRSTNVDFVRDIKPVLERSCAACHSGESPKGGFRVTDRTQILLGGESEEAAIVPGSSGNSPLLGFIAGTIEDMEMPPLDKQAEFPALSKHEIATFRAWIDAGATWPEGVKIKPPPY